MGVYVGVAAAWNVITFILYGIDKRKAVKRKWRISENTLLLSAFLMGSIGALLGMSVFHHKTKHLKFKIGVPVALVFNAVIAAIIYYFYKA